MRGKAKEPKASAEKVIKDFRHTNRKHHSAKEKIGIVLGDLGGERQSCLDSHHRPFPFRVNNGSRDPRF